MNKETIDKVIEMNGVWEAKEKEFHAVRGMRLQYKVRVFKEEDEYEIFVEERNLLKGNERMTWRKYTKDYKFEYFAEHRFSFVWRDTDMILSYLRALRKELNKQ